MPSTEITDALEVWMDVSEEGPWPSLLLGNGSSIAVWKHFSYDSLYDQAGLAADDAALFDALGPTTNFELVLDALRVSRLVCEQLGHDDDDVTQRYGSIRDALITAVNSVHVPWAQVPKPTFGAMSSALVQHRAVYSTNYDLLAYWSLMDSASTRDWGDAFWNLGSEFDESNVVPLWDMTLVHFLHGALHLYRTADGGTVKRVATGTRTLLDLLGTPFSGADMPLFVSEGTSEDKMRVIRSSDYLSFAYGALVDDDRPLVVFGNSLSSQDDHLVRAINRHSRRQVAVGVRPSTALRVIDFKTRILQRLDGPVRFFDAETHPLGDPILQMA